MDEMIRKNHFDLLHTRPVEDVGGTLWEMEHEKTGTKLVWLERPDENMTFTICFKTIPEDSTGVFHILEHSVLLRLGEVPLQGALRGVDEELFTDLPQRHDLPG